MARFNSILVYGAGSWGSALASYFSDIGKNTTIFSRDQQVCSEINSQHKNTKYLPNIFLSKRLQAVNQISDWNLYDLVVLAVPSGCFEDTLNMLKLSNVSEDTVFLIATKGLVAKPTQLLSDKFIALLPNIFCFIYGPNLACEVSDGCYSSATISSSDFSMARVLSSELSSERFVMDASDDIITLQIAAIMKNIFAIKTGMLSYSHVLAHNTQASLIVEYFKEILELSGKLGGSLTSISNYAFLGDLIATNYSVESWNYKFGQGFRQSNFSSNFIAHYPFLVEGLVSLRLIRGILPQGTHLPHLNSLFECFGI